MRRRNINCAIALLVSSCFLVTAAPPYKERWVPKYFYDEDGSSLVITDLQFPTAKRGIASGYIAKQKEKDKPVILVTTDGGDHWTVTPVKEVARSLFFLEDGTGWMVGERNIWKTQESGRSWEKLKDSPKDILQLWFNTREHGWAVGARKQVFETKDGGTTWTALEAAALPSTNPETTTYGVVTFANANDGIIAGWNDPQRRSDLPNWVDPAKARDRPQWPTTLILLQTRDGGITWASSKASIFGHTTRIAMGSEGLSLGLIEFTDSFAYPSEVFLFRARNGGKSERVFRKANRAITDVLLTKSGTAYLAGTEATGTIHDSPVPGKLKIMRSTDMQIWTEMPVDYRADAHRAIIASPDEENIWVATDTGMILKLVREP